MSYPFPIYIGFDPDESVAFHVLEHSLRKHSSIPLAITPLSRNNLWPVFTRPRRDNESTEFSFSRFLVPYLARYNQWALYMDCDCLVRGDVAEIAAMCNLANWYKAVYVVKHDYESIVKTKFFNQPNEPYPKKNQSSVMLFNNYRCRALTPEVVNQATGPYLHRFEWLPDDQVGELPAEWNHLVSEYPENPLAKNLHFTLGGPYLPDCDGCEGSDEWWEAYGEMTHAKTSGLCGKTPLIRVIAAEGRTRRAGDRAA